MADKKIIAVTGSNTGLGLAMVRQFLKLYGETAIVYLTARSEERGRAAVAELEAEGLSPAFHLLDVTIPDSVKTFAEHIEKTHGGIDSLVLNAAQRISRDIPQPEQVERFINTNNHGTYRMVKTFTPLLRDGARVVIVASSFGSLRHLNPNLRSRFDISTMSLEDVEAVMDDYASALMNGEAESQGWPSWINIPSKIGQVASMKVLARDLCEEAERRHILINAACPGLVDTEASRPWFDDMSHAKSPDEAATDVVWLATLPPEAQEPYGELVQYRRVLSFAGR